MQFICIQEQQFDTVSQMCAHAITPNPLTAIFSVMLEHRFPNWGARTPRGTQSGSGGTRGENVRDNRKRTEFAECTV